MKISAPTFARGAQIAIVVASTINLIDIMAEALPMPDDLCQTIACPFSSEIRLRVIVPESLLCACTAERAAKCQWAISIGEGYFCRALWKSRSPA